jgi:hypothetical protein
MSDERRARAAALLRRHAYPTLADELEAGGEGADG